MTFTPHGKHLIAGDWVAGATTFQSDPAHGPAHPFSVGSPELVDAAVQAAEDAFWKRSHVPKVLHLGVMVSEHC